MWKLVYKITAYLFYIYFKIYYNIEIEGIENIPHKGSLVVMANHVSYLDPPVVGVVLTRQVHFMAKEELFENPLFGYLLKKIGAFPVKRGRPDTKAIKHAFNILQNNEVLGLFPEGTRSKNNKLKKAKSGAIMIPLKKKSPILPIGIKYKNTKLKVSIGKPFNLKEFYNRKLNKEELEKAGETIMNKIAFQLKQIK